jgi:aspartyl/asparaginyl-tRNA synthetase
VKEQNHKIALVIDTNVLVKQTKLMDMLKVPDRKTFEQLFDVITLNEVIAEVKDEAARNYIENGLDFQMQLKSAATYVEKADLIFVQNFAKDTGDFKSLSMVD